MQVESFPKLQIWTQIFKIFSDTSSKPKLWILTQIFKEESLPKLQILTQIYLKRLMIQEAS